MSDRYDAGYINDFGGGDTNWWADYLRAEVERANDFHADIHEQTDARIAALEAENERLRKALDEIDAAASAAYCASLRQFEKDECLGWVRKVEAGKFGEAEHKAHQQANMLMGKSQGLWEALKIARAALEAKP